MGLAEYLSEKLGVPYEPRNASATRNVEAANPDVQKLGLANLMIVNLGSMLSGDSRVEDFVLHTPERVTGEDLCKHVQTYYEEQGWHLSPTQIFPGREVSMTKEQEDGTHCLTAWFTNDSGSTNRLLRPDIMVSVEVALKERREEASQTG